MRFSVLLSVYAKENPAYFNSAFLSIWDQQTLKPDQIVLVKDGPLTPEMDAEIGRWQAELCEILTVVELPQNLGLGAALNVGLQYCQYELVARMDTDDVSLPQRFEKQVAFMLENPAITILGAGAIEMDENGIAFGQRIYPQQHQEIVDMLWTNPLIHPSIMFRKSFIEQIGGYDSALTRRQDYELWFRAYEHGARFANISDPLIRYRFVTNTHSRQKPRDVWQFAMIGYRSSQRIGLPIWKRLGCFFPFFKSLLPPRLQHRFAQAMRLFDPRHQGSSQ